MTKTFVSVAAVGLVLFSIAALPAAALLGETIVLDDVPVCRLPGLLIEA